MDFLFAIECPLSGFERHGKDGQRTPDRMEARKNVRREDRDIDNI